MKKGMVVLYALLMDVFYVTEQEMSEVANMLQEIS